MIDHRMGNLALCLSDHDHHHLECHVDMRVWNKPPRYQFAVDYIGHSVEDSLCVILSDIVDDYVMCFFHRCNGGGAMGPRVGWIRADSIKKVYT